MIEQTVAEICSALQKHKFEVLDEERDYCVNDRILQREPVDHKGMKFQAEITLVQIGDQIKISGGFNVDDEGEYHSLFVEVDFTDIENMENLVQLFNGDINNVYMAYNYHR